MKKNWPSVSQKAKKEISKIVEYMILFFIFKWSFKNFKTSKKRKGDKNKNKEYK
jgi:hypothetical protein